MSKDLGLKMGTPEEADWTRIKKAQEDTVRNSKISIAIAEKVLKLAEEEIVKEKAKFQKI